MGPSISPSFGSVFDPGAIVVANGPVRSSQPHLVAKNEQVIRCCIGASSLCSRITNSSGGSGRPLSYFSTRPDRIEEPPPLSGTATGAAVRIIIGADDDSHKEDNARTSPTELDGTSVKTVQADVAGVSR